MKISFCASIVACMVLASGGSLRAQHEAAEVPLMSQGYAVGHSQPAYPVTGSYLPPAYSAEELLWFRGEYLLWWFKDADIPPLVTTAATPNGRAGALGRPDTHVLFGDELEYDAINGARFVVGGWLDEHRTFGAEVNFFSFSEGTDEFAIVSPGSPIVSRPVFDVATGVESVFNIASPDQNNSVVNGRVDIRSSSRLIGIEINGLCDPWYDVPDSGGDLDLLYGFRYVDLDEDLGIADAQGTIDIFNGIPVIATLERFDFFQARNRFYGGQVGFQWQARRGPFSVRLAGKLGLGATHQNVRIDGRRVLRISGIGTSSPRGSLAQRTNIGEYSRDQFSVLPEIGAYLGYEILEGLSLYAGYTFLYWTNVARPGDQIDRVINSSFLGNSPSGPPRPAFNFEETDFWAHGLTLGASLTF